jgi:hypothetical protein
VPLRRVAVEVSLAGEPARRVEMFLGEHGHRAWHRQEVLDLLEGGRQFLPCQDPEQETATLINRDHIIWVAIPVEEDRSPSDEVPDLDLLYDRRHQVVLRLAGGTSLEGAFLFTAPDEHSRLTDYLNQAGGFLALHWADQIFLVRKSAIVEIVEIKSPAERPAGTRGEPR